MPKYRITITETVSQTSFVDVEAADELAALEIFTDDDLQFELDYTHIPGRDEVLTRELYSIAPQEPRTAMPEPETTNSVAACPPPCRCPFCGGINVQYIDTLHAMTNSRLSFDGVAWDLDEWQCRGLCDGRSFFV